jgi:sec-independent protein translocase protein TatA
VGEFSITHLLLLAVVVLIFFGPSRLPALGQSLGKAIKGFKQGLTEIEAEAKPIEDTKKTADEIKQSQLNQNQSPNPDAQPAQKESKKV